MAQLCIFTMVYAESSSPSPVAVQSAVPLQELQEAAATKSRPSRTGKARRSCTLGSPLSVAYPMRGFPYMGIPRNGWFIMEYPIKMDESRVAQIAEIATIHHMGIGQDLFFPWPEASSMMYILSFVLNDHGWNAGISTETRSWFHKWMCSLLMNGTHACISMRVYYIYNIIHILANVQS